MTIWVVSLEWNHPPSEVTGDSGISGVFATEAEARACRLEEQREYDDNGELVYQYTYAEGRYCIGCGELATDAAGQVHTCPEVDEAFCDQCGAELTDHGTCDNDHDEWTIDVHVTEHAVKAAPLDRIHQAMTGREWGADTLEAVAGILTEAGYILAEPAEA